MVGRSPLSLSLPWSMPLVASNSFLPTCFQREYGAVMTKSHFCASDAGPTLMSRASPSKRSITTPRDSGKFLSGSASITSPTVHFHPLAADLYTLDLFTSSFTSVAHSSDANLAMFLLLVPKGKPPATRLPTPREQGRRLPLDLAEQPGSTRPCTPPGSR